MQTRQLFWTIPLLGMFALPAIAHDYDDHGRHDNRFEQRLDRQHWRIKQGIRSGELTRKEAKRLRRQQRRIDKLEHKFSRDGHIDRYERRVLRSKLDDASQRIYRFKHNDRYRGRYNDRHHRSHRRHDDGWAFALNYWD